MFSVYNLLLFAHVILFVYWLGSDVGVFYGVRFVLDPKLSLETRRTVMALTHWIDALPRLCLVLMVPVGLSLAITLGLVPMPAEVTGPVLGVIWLVGLIWAAMVYRIYHGALGAIRTVDMVVRVSVMLGFIGAGSLSLAGHGPVVGANWLAVKMVLFGLIIGCGIALRFLGQPFGAAYAAIMANGSTPQAEHDLTAAMHASKRVVIVLWLLVAATAFLGLTKPF